MRRPRVPEYLGADVEGRTWEDFLEWFSRVWKPGQHVALVGPTGMGKSTFAVGILELRRYVLALDPKGGDETLESSGYERLTSWPLPNEAYDRIAEGKHARYIVGNISRTLSDRIKLRQVLADTLAGVFESRGWTVYADEFQLLADRKMMNLGNLVEQLLIAARSKFITVVTSYQAPAWVPAAASRQATWIVLWPTRDVDVVKKLANVVGRDWRMIWSAMKALPPFHVLIIGRNPHEPMVVTSAPERT
jgi:hypothetical protein